MQREGGKPDTRPGGAVEILLVEDNPDVALRSLPVVILTSSNEEADLVAAWTSGTNSYVTKPVQFPEFEKVVTDLGLYWLMINRVPGE